MREKVTKFDFESAFKELDGLDIPTPEKVTKETNDNFLREKLNKPFFSSEALFEEFYDINDQQDLEEAQEEREDEVAKAKLARIEKIVDLDADSPDELLGSYEGKIIIQCPQCMTKFYKNKEDLEYSEDDPNVVNVNEPCQHCGNISGYDVIGKVAPVDETDEVDLDMEETTEEAPEEGADEMEEVEAEETEDNGETEEDFDLDFETEEETGEEEANESFYHSSDLWMLTEAFGDDEDEKLADDEDAEIDAELDAAAEADDEETEEETDDEEIEAIDVLTDKLDAEGDEDTVTIAEKGQLENPDAPKLEIEVTEEEGEALADEFCDGEKEFDAEVDKDIEDLEDEEAEAEEEADEEIEEGLDEAIGDEEPVAEPALGKKMTNLSLNDIFADAMSYLHESLELDAKNEALNESLNEDSKIAQAAKKLLNSKEFKMFDKEGESLDTASVTESCEGEACEEKEECKEEECKEELTEDAQEAAYKKASNNIINKLKSDVDAIKAQGDDYIPESIDDIEDIDEESFEECFTEALKAKQDNVTGFRISNCYRLNNQLVFEGYALSGDKVLKERHTFAFNENFVSNTKKTKMKFKGLNESFNNKSTCNIACAMKQNVLTADKLLESKTLNEAENIEEGVFDKIKTGAKNLAGKIKDKATDRNGKLNTYFGNKFIVVPFKQENGKNMELTDKIVKDINDFGAAEAKAKALSTDTGITFTKVYGGDAKDNEKLVCTYVKNSPTKDSRYNRIDTLIANINADKKIEKTSDTSKMDLGTTDAAAATAAENPKEETAAIETTTTETTVGNPKEETQKADSKLVYLTADEKNKLADKAKELGINIEGKEKEFFQLADKLYMNGQEKAAA